MTEDNWSGEGYSEVLPMPFWSTFLYMQNQVGAAPTDKYTEDEFYEFLSIVNSVKIVRMMFKISSAHTDENITQVVGWLLKSFLAFRFAGGTPKASWETINRINAEALNTLIANRIYLIYEEDYECAFNS